jgi:hypothetical protein
LRFRAGGLRLWAEPATVGEVADGQDVLEELAQVDAGEGVPLLDFEADDQFHRGVL